LSDIFATIDHIDPLVHQGSFDSVKAGDHVAANIRVSSVIEFIDAVSKLTKRITSIHVFRGQRNSEWIDNPGILRQSSKMISHEYSAVRDLQSVHPQEFYQDLNMFDKLVRMQHYGLPTRLMDVSSNPLVALFFATEPYRSTKKEIDGRVVVYDVPKIRRKYFDSDSVSCVSNLANLTDEEKAELLDNEKLDIDDFQKLPSCDRLIQFIRAEKAHFRPAIKPTDLSRAYYVTPKMQNNRIIAQHGAFIIFGLRIVMTKRSTENDSTITRTLIDIPQAAKALIRRELDMLGINAGTLFPDLGHAASEIVRKYSQ
jgi:hypothetical protein